MRLPSWPYSKKHIRQAKIQLETWGLQVLVTEGLWVPLVHIQGVYILPGIPRLFQQMVSAHQHRFNGPPFLGTALYTHMGEGDLAGEAPLMLCGLGFKA